jgi:hypothetical protein
VPTKRSEALRRERRRQHSPRQQPLWRCPRRRRRGGLLLERTSILESFDRGGHPLNGTLPSNDLAILADHQVAERVRLLADVLVHVDGFVSLRQFVQRQWV